MKASDKNHKGNIFPADGDTLKGIPAGKIISLNHWSINEPMIHQLKNLISKHKNKPDHGKKENRCNENINSSKKSTGSKTNNKG